MYKGFYTILDPHGKDIGLRLYDEQDASGVVRFYRNTDQGYTVRQAFGFKSIAPGNRLDRFVADHDSTGDTPSLRAPLASALGDGGEVARGQAVIDFIHKELPKNTWYWTMNGAGVRTSMPTPSIDEVIDTYTHHAQRNVGELIIAVVDWKLMPELGRFGTESGSVAEGSSKEGD
jgi:hypothetical protein